MLNMLFMLKKIAAPLLLASFLMVAFFGFSFMSMQHGSDGRMQGDCPFSATGTPLCPQDAFAAAMHHLSAYQSFFGVSVDTAIVALMSALLFAVLYVLVSLIRPFILKPPIRGRHSYCSPPISACTSKITRWLSLLENSPSSC